ncbi:hypothetical protein AALP_AA6G092400 [Arabis alpina]|uniref:Uncharacterized protein n=1 Tax=Arabis alpina TaxID=50452 RepID=A0A087GN32_ARAAL|nr:hypothetical protein AALP_AA6G092400 [Arabis alpina]
MEGVSYLDFSYPNPATRNDIVGCESITKENKPT